MIRLFVHEVYRVFYDRLVDDQDRAWLFKLISNIVKEHFKENFETVFEHLKAGNKLVRKKQKFPPQNFSFSKWCTWKLLNYNSNLVYIILISNANF